MHNYNKIFLEKLTILIFSYNRHKYLKRTIKYWSNYNIKLLVIDGSDVKLEESFLDTKNIKYIYDQRSLYDRLLSSIDYIDSEFIILSCDDEFYLPSALSACVEFLLKEPSFFSCGGRSIGFGTSNDGKKIFGCEQYSKFRNLCLDDSNVLKRMHSHFNNYVPAHMYSVMRFNKWKIICKYVYEKEYNFFAAMELQTEFLATVSDKSKIIPELMWMRNKEVPGIRDTSPATSQAITINQWWYDKKFKKEKEDFLCRMKQACYELLNEKNFIITENIISKLFKIYINNKYSKKTFYRKIADSIPNKIKKLIKPVLKIKNKFIISKFKNLSNQISLLEAEGVFVNHDELDQIILALKDLKNETN
jgi:glycosyltransferase domain-containing protein